MRKVIYYKKLIERLTSERDKASWESNRYMRLNSVLNRIIDWQLKDLS